MLVKKSRERKRAMRSFAMKIIKKWHLLFPISVFEIAKLYLLSRLCKKAIAARERVRYKQAEMYYRFKEIVKLIGTQSVERGLIKDRSEMFYYTYKEIGELLSSSNMQNVNIDERIANWKLESERVYPHNFSTDFGTRPAHVETTQTLVDGAKEFKGLAASGGCIKAKVKVLDTVLEGDKLERGEILVTKQTRPWMGNAISNCRRINCGKRWCTVSWCYSS